MSDEAVARTAAKRAVRRSDLTTLCLLAFEVASLALQVRSLSARLAADVGQANVRFSVILEEGVLIRGVHLHVLGCLFGGPCRVVE